MACFERATSVLLTTISGVMTQLFMKVGLFSPYMKRYKLSRPQGRLFCYTIVKHEEVLSFVSFSGCFINVLQ